VQYQASDIIAHILFIEDELSVSDALRECLELRGFEVSVVQRAKDAITLLGKITPDLILSDFNLPGLSGFEFFKEIKSNPLWNSIPFLFISGESTPEIINATLEAGGDYFVKKPIDIEELSSVIRGQLSQTKLKEESSEQRLDAFKKRVVHTLSHEFRTPLVSITTGSELLLEEYDALDDAQIKNLLTSIYRGGQRLERLVEDFMAIQQMDTGETEASFKQFLAPVSVGEMLTRVEDEVQIRLAHLYNNFEVNFAIEDSLSSLMINVCAPQLIDAFVRLIDNACKFTLTEKRIVNFNVTKEDKSIVFKIRDWGKGMPLDCSSQLQAVTPFTQIRREVHEQQGCGLGLTIAMHYIKIHGGELKLGRPDEGPGMLVSVSLPLA